MITAEIMGGLGNQMFIIFTLMAYSLDNKNIFYFEKKEQMNGSRQIVYWNNILQHLGKFCKPVQHIDVIIRETSMNYDILPKIVNAKLNAKLHGYFQSFRYFNERMRDILKLMKFNEIVMPYRNLYNYENIISIHFRLGDYKNLPNYHPILNLEFYKRSLRIIIEKTEIENWQVLYFYENEDIDCIEQHIEQLKINFPTLSFLGVNNELSDWEQMITMSLCTHNIIANSSFSWWAAYLNSNTNIVCCPDIILGPDARGNIKFEDRYPPLWTIVNAL